MTIFQDAYLVNIDTSIMKLFVLDAKMVIISKVKISWRLFEVKENKKKVGPVPSAASLIA